MEIVLGVALVASLLFGGSEALENRRLTKEVIELKVELNTAQNDIQSLLEVNKSNVNFMVETRKINAELVKDNQRLRELQVSYDKINEFSELGSKELEEHLSDYDWSDVRIPLPLFDAISVD